MFTDEVCKGNRRSYVCNEAISMLLSEWCDASASLNDLINLELEKKGLSEPNS